jgi:Flp pilus assembly protein protease CpaA
MSPMARRLVTLVSLALSAAITIGLVAAGPLAAPSRALADGDPASDMLLGENVFYPYSPAVARALQSTLNGETAAAKRAGLPIKVAIIASPIDLGAIGELFGKPAAYASFLDKEISFTAPQPLLVVMASGYGLQGIRPPASLALAALPRPSGRSPDDLARAAIVAVRRLSAADGHPLAVVSLASGTTGGLSPVLLVVLVLAAILVAGTLILVRRRQASPRRAPARRR